MNGLIGLCRKQLVESRWLLGLSCLAFFGLSWFSVYRTAGVETLLAGDFSERQLRTRGIMRALGGPSMDFSSTAIEMVMLTLPSLGVPLLLTIIWAISRGTGAVAGDLERGTMDLVLSRPVSRSSYLGAHVLACWLGLLALAMAIVAGNLFGCQMYKVENPSTVLKVLRPALNLSLLGMAAFGYTVLLSSLDSVRWRPNMIASVATLLQFVAFAVANQPDWDRWKWLNRLSIFSAYWPVEAAVAGKALPFNAAVLGGIGLAGVAVAFLVFTRRDLPASAG